MLFSPGKGRKKTVKIPAVPRSRAFAIQDFGGAIPFFMSQSSGSKKGKKHHVRHD
jgi:hypothetical protein